MFVLNHALFNEYTYIYIYIYMDYNQSYYMYCFEYQNMCTLF